MDLELTGVGRREGQFGPFGSSGIGGHTPTRKLHVALLLLTGPCLAKSVVPQRFCPMEELP